MWAKQFGITIDNNSSIAVDAAGNIYTEGFFIGTADFDPGVDTFNLTSIGTRDIFISKLDGNGNFVWAKQFGGSSIGYNSSIAVDSLGNIYTTGDFAGTVDFDPGVSTFNLISAGNRDIFVSKLDANGNFVWAKQVGGTASEYGYSIAVDALGNVYTRGTFAGTVDFDPGIGIFNVTASGNVDVFISKLDASGNFIWAKQLGATPGSNDYWVQYIAVDASGNVYITGSFRNTVDFNPGAGTFNLTSSVNDDIFVSKLDASGNFAWAKKIGGSSYDHGFFIAVDASGNNYTTGLFQRTVDFDPGAGTFYLTDIGLANAFISRLDASGNFSYAKQFAGMYLEIESTTIDESGNSYSTGYFKGTADVDPGAATFNLTSMGDDDIFINKLDANGNLSWAKQMGGMSDERGSSITVDVSGYIYTTGYFEGTVDFDPGVGTFNLTSTGEEDIFVSKLDAAGNFVWAKQMGGISEERSSSITIDTFGNIYTTGYFYGTADFNPGVATYNLTAAFSRDIFVSKIDATGNFVWAKQMGGTGPCNINSIVIDASGSIYTTGYFYGTVDFNPGAATFNLTSAGSSDIFISKFDASGNFVWAGRMGSTSGDSGSEITTDVSGNVYSTGYFRDTVDFDLGAGTFSVASAGGADIFISKLDTNGNFVWSKRFGSTSNDYGNSIAVDAPGNIYSTGYFYDTADFDPGSGVFNLISAGYGDIFISKLDSVGNFGWVKQIGGIYSDYGNFITFDASGNLYIEGSFQNTVDFDPGPGTINLTANFSSLDRFILKLSDSAIKLELKAFLSGDYNSSSGLMNDSLRKAGYIPLTEPYTGTFDHYGYGGGEVIDTSVLLVSGDNAIVDWVFVELRDKSDSTVVVATRSALIQKDGDVVEVDGSSPLSFNGLPADDYYVVIRHINHFGVMAASPVALGTTPISVDFTNPATATWGTDAQQFVNGKMVMWSGNVFLDDVIKYSGLNNDRDPILTKIGGVVPTNVEQGYNSEDVNRDGNVKYSGINNDRDIILQNIGGVVPTNTILEQLPTTP